jgi:protein sidekick
LFSGYPQPVYKWLKNGIAVTNFTNGQYHRIQNANKNDVGSYSCQAKNDAGTIFSEKINVAVAYMEGFQDLTERTVSVLAGHAAILDLALIDSVPKPQVTWLSSEGLLDYDIKYATTLDKQLIILSVSKKDEMAYRARAINTQLGKEESSPFIRLNVTGDDYYDVAPRIIIAPRSVKAARGEEIVELQCIANAKNLHELETLWFKDEIPIENAGIRYTFNDPWNRTLALMSLNMTHSGLYVCKVRLKSGGFEESTDPAEIVVQEPPTFFQPLRTEILGDYGSSLTIPCDAIGEPFPNITWFKDAKPIDLTSDRYSMGDGSSLVIKKLSLDDSAMFQCLAENDAGEKSTYTWIKVKSE